MSDTLEPSAGARVKVALEEAGPRAVPVLRRMMQLYLYDLGTIDGWNISAEGLYGDPQKIERFWTERGRRSFFIRADGALAGFALIRDEATYAGAGTHEVSEFFLGPYPWGQSGREPGVARAAAQHAGLEVVDLRTETLKMEFHDVGAMIYYLRKVIWMVPDFTVEAYRDRLIALHEQIGRDGPFISHSRRFLIEARKPA